MSGPRTYLDHNATAPLRPEARAAMLAALELQGNASSVHAEGRRAREAIEAARDEVAALVSVAPEQVVFTSGATEANTWALRAGWDVIAVSAIEHESVLATALVSGARVVEVACQPSGRACPAAAREAASAAIPGSGRALASIGLANGETGVLQPVAEISAVIRDVSADATVHTDAVQALGRVPVDFGALGVDLMSLSAHKIGGPKGAGALVIRPGLDLPALMLGGGQERRRRAGTENIAAIAGFGAAARAARQGLADLARIRALRDHIEAGVRQATPDAVFVGAGSERLPNTSCIAMPGAKAATLLIRLDLAGIAVSAGSACSSGKIGGSHVLAAMGLPSELAAAAIRISLGPSSTLADADRFIAAWRGLHAARSHRPASSIRAAATARSAHPIQAGE